jgi:GNAT superfamily N-acetyltransferase
MDYIVRKATLEDREAIGELIAESTRQLSREHYADAQIEAALASVFGVDSDLIQDETYFVAEKDGMLIGCGGWSRRKKLYGGDRFANREAEFLDPAVDPAKIRAFFVHSQHARKGVARAILNRCEQEANKHGFRALELLSTLPGLRFYEACGYSRQGHFELELDDDVKLPFVPMGKSWA